MLLGSIGLCVCGFFFGVIHVIYEIVACSNSLSTYAPLEKKKKAREPPYVYFGNNGYA